MDFQAYVTAYYDALRAGDPLGPFFAEHDTVVKFGIHEALRGGEAVATGLAQQTDRTTNWEIRSHALQTDQVSGTGWFADRVGMAWTDTEAAERYDLPDTRWSGTAILVDGDWQFVSMHVSVPYEFFAVAGERDAAETAQ